ncbi:MAG: glutaredoxin 3 [Granulosicoccus sp.]|nr:glutaredoxin 3 [Granulosicoccus sp.]
MAAEITIYISNLCGYCRAATSMLEKKGWSYNSIVVDGRDDLWDEMQKKSQRNTVPQIWIGETHVGGFDDLAELDMDGELDALYESK